MAANDRQVGGSHYKKGGEEHWDRAWRLKYDPFQYIITKWVERWREKGGLDDLLKAQHAIEKYIELVKAERFHPAIAEPDATGPGPGYVNQDPDVNIQGLCVRKELCDFPIPGHHMERCALPKGHIGKCRA